jgi:6-phosphogluconate dehydrogenase
MKSDIGLYGLAVMGENLALNIARAGFSIAVFNRTVEKAEKLASGRAKAPEFGGRLSAAKSAREFVAGLERPRRIILLVKAGKPVDEAIQTFAPLLEPGDIVIDGGNSDFRDTRRRCDELAAKGLHFVGSGVSGGEEGALYGPSLMPGGAREAYEAIRPIWEAIAAKSDSGPCTTYVGPDGAGHFVKMVHNGIEYGDMQLIAEAYHLLRDRAGCGAPELHEIFAAWNRGDLSSFLIEITARIFTVVDDETRKPLVDLILDKAGQKGTGKWTVQIALELGVPVPTIAAAVDARALSSMKDQRARASKELAAGARPAPIGDRKAFVERVRRALHASKICSYAQGFAMMQAADKEYGWGLDFAEIARIWKAGCIIRSRFLDDIAQAYRRDPKLPNLLLDPKFKAWVGDALDDWRDVVGTAASAGIPAAAFAASLAYYDASRTESLPQNLTQAQRDFFGAHTYERVDKPEAGALHTDWFRLAKPLEPAS